MEVSEAKRMRELEAENSKLKKLLAGTLLEKTAIIARLKQLGVQYPRYGYLMLHAMMRTGGLVQNRKRTYRLYSSLGMQVRTKKRK